MPYVRMETNSTLDEKTFIKAFSKFISKSLGKPEMYVMISIETKKMVFGGNEDPCMFVELKSIGLPKDSTSNLSKEICNFIEKETKIKSERIYINFVNFDGSMWGWNGTTF